MNPKIAETEIIQAIQRVPGGMFAKIFTTEGGRKLLRVAGSRAAVEEFLESQAPAGTAHVPPPPAVCLSLSSKEAKKMSGFAGYFQKGVEELEKQIQSLSQRIEQKAQQAEQQMQAKAQQAEKKMDEQARAFEKRGEEKLAGLDGQVKAKFAEQDKKITENSQKLHTELRDSAQKTAAEVKTLEETVAQQAVDLAGMVEKIAALFEKIEKLRVKLGEFIDILQE